MEKTLNKVTTKIRERILELNVKLKVQGLTQFSFELNKHGYPLFLLDLIKVF